MFFGKKAQSNFKFKIGKTQFPVVTLNGYTQPLQCSRKIKTLQTLPPTSFGQGNVFTRMCHSVHGVGVCLQGGLHPGVLGWRKVGLQRVCILGSLPPGRGLPPGGSASRGYLSPGGLGRPPPQIPGILRDTVNKLRYASYQNTFLLKNIFVNLSVALQIQS